MYQENAKSGPCKGIPLARRSSWHKKCGFTGIFDFKDENMKVAALPAVRISTD
jgi:hypothetical protein